MRNTVIYVAAALVLLAGCRKQDERVSREQMGGGAGDVPVGFVIENVPATKSGGVSESWTEDSAFVVRHVPCPAEDDGGMTKVDVTTTANLSSFYLNISKGTGTETSVEENRLFSKGEGGQFRAGLYWPITDPKYHFYASNIEMMTGSDRSSVSCPADKDVVCAYLAEPTYFLVNTLEFSHVYARIGSVSVTPPAGYVATLKSAQLDCGVSGTYDMKTGTWSSASSKTVTLSESNDVWVVPGKYTLSATFTLSDGKVSEDVTCGGEITLQAGCVNNIEATSKAFFSKKLVLSPASASVNVGGTVTFGVTCETYYGSKKVDSFSVLAEHCSWQSGDASKVTVSAGTATGKANGTATITASYGEATGSASVTVVNTLVSLSISPANKTVNAWGHNVTYTTTAYWSDGSTQDVSTADETTYTSDNEEVAYHQSSAAKNVIHTGFWVWGLAHITASYKGLTAVANLGVGSDDGLTVAPASATITIGGQQEYRAYLMYDEKTIDVTSSTTFTSSSTGIATISGNVATGAGLGTCTVTASYDGGTATATLTVADKEYRNPSVSISANPMALPVTGGVSTLTYSAGYEWRYKYAGGTYGEWTAASGEPVISGEAAGFTRSGQYVTAFANVGDARSVTYNADFTAPDGTKAERKSVTIAQAGKGSPVSLTISPESKTILQGDTQSYTVMAYYSDGSSQNVTSKASYAAVDVTGTNVATMTGNIATGKNVGTCNVTATFSGLSAVSALTVKKFDIE